VAVANREPLLGTALVGMANVHHSEFEGAGGVLDALQRFH